MYNFYTLFTYYYLLMSGKKLCLFLILFPTFFLHVFAACVRGEMCCRSVFSCVYLTWIAVCFFTVYLSRKRFVSSLCQTYHTQVIFIFQDYVRGKVDCSFFCVYLYFHIIHKLLFIFTDYISRKVYCNHFFVYIWPA